MPMVGPPPGRGAAAGWGCDVEDMLVEPYRPVTYRRVQRRALAIAGIPQACVRVQTMEGAMQDTTVRALPRVTRFALAVVVGLGMVVATVATGCASDGDGAAGASSQAASAEPVVRDRLGATKPENAPGQELFLEQVTIAPGARLATHYHEGTQVAHVVSGELTYNIVRGTATVLRADGPEQATGPTVVVLRAGDGVVETPDVVHFGANNGDEPVVIVLAALLADGAPMATAIDDEPTAVNSGGG